MEKLNELYMYGKKIKEVVRLFRILSDSCLAANQL